MTTGALFIKCLIARWTQFDPALSRMPMMNPLLGPGSGVAFAAQTEPPQHSTLSLTSANPSPAPPSSRLRDVSTLKKGSNKLGKSDSGTPGPLS